MIELRWKQDSNTTAKLQYRQTYRAPNMTVQTWRTFFSWRAWEEKWGEWRDVPIDKKEVA